jgi:hypothetical protein
VAAVSSLAHDSALEPDARKALAGDLGDFFDIWGQPLSRQRVGPALGHVTALFAGHVFTGNPRQIPLLAHAQIQLEVGKPRIAPQRITFPPGL